MDLLMVDGTVTDPVPHFHALWPGRESRAAKEVTN
jgi:hypothetical protein